jgi:error-prone DNA polymerase
MSLVRPGLPSRVKSAAALHQAKNRSKVEVAGLIIVRQRPGTAAGIIFISLEDETGIANLVVMPDVYERFRPLVRGAPFVIARGTVERAGKVVNVRVREIEPLSLAPPEAPRSRDFH